MLCALLCRQDSRGSVTAGNASPMTDGAAALVLTSRAKAQELGLNILAVIRAQADANQAPEWWALVLELPFAFALLLRLHSSSSISVTMPAVQVYHDASGCHPQSSVKGWVADTGR